MVGTGSGLRICIPKKLRKVSLRGGNCHIRFVIESLLDWTQRHSAINPSPVLINPAPKFALTSVACNPLRLLLRSEAFNLQHATPSSTRDATRPQNRNRLHLLKFLSLSLFSIWVAVAAGGVDLGQVKNVNRPGDDRGLSAVVGNRCAALPISEFLAALLMFFELRAAADSNAILLIRTRRYKDLGSADVASRSMLKKQAGLHRGVQARREELFVATTIFMLVDDLVSSFNKLMMI
ncbi:hypothetical protein Nepgr_033978 [Nepenthes gracilis]|uniref:Uncharacterized protein n=1 Tax=Nepenthes gracilis TaxID=150966 RepID=A0AAD3TMX4_NEPGR|nr:hypothetical protein Nepgr_033978 [Nepenthes gracilis]